MSSCDQLFLRLVTLYGYRVDGKVARRVYRPLPAILFIKIEP